MDISKKDLLQETGISYGQLYRWKREGLIPEEWFMKKASYTGQETYFPKEKILTRIKAIQQLKDKYSLEELAKMLTPEVSNRMFSEEDLEQFVEIDIDLAASFMDILEKDEFTFTEVIMMIALTRIYKEQAIAYEEMQDILKGVIPHLDHMESVDYLLILIDVEQHYYAMLCKEGTDIYLDERMKQIEQIHLQELSNEMKVKYKETFQFEFEEDVIK